MSSLFADYLSSPEVSDALSDRAVVHAMLRFEAALAKAQAQAGLITPAAAQSIVGTCKVDLFDVPRLVRDSVDQRCLATPLVDALRDTVALFNAEAAQAVHLGCSTADLQDSTLALLMRDVLALLMPDLAQTIDTLQKLAAAHADVAALARPAPPAAPTLTTFGLTCAQWAAPLRRCQQRLQAVSPLALRLHLGSDTHALQAMAGQAAPVARAMAADLQLSEPTPVDPAQRDESVLLACELGLLCAQLGSIANAIARRAQAEVGEVTQVSAAAPMTPGAKPAHCAPLATLCSVARANAEATPALVAGLLASLADAHPGAVQTHWTLWPRLLANAQTLCRTVRQLVGSIRADSTRLRKNLTAARLDSNAEQLAVLAELARGVSSLAAAP